MHFVLATSDPGTLALGLAIAAVLGGLVAGMLGVDSGIVVVPVLYHVLALIGVDQSLRMHLAVGTSLAAIIPASLASFRTQDKGSAIDRDILRRWAAPMFAGVLIGCALADFASAPAQALIFALVALAVALYLAFGGEKRRLAERLPDGVGGLAVPALIGGVSAMMGIGGGTLGVPAMTLSAVPAPRAIGTASALGAIIAIPGTIAAVAMGWHAPGLPPYSLGYVNVLGVVLIAPVSLLMAPVGRALGHMTDRDRLRILFAFFIVLATGRMLYDAFG
ncbi:MAG: sulfite exporter TauE/SafE family protein [Rhizomicrobium sp.]